MIESNFLIDSDQFCETAIANLAEVSRILSNICQRGNRSNVMDIIPQPASFLYRLQLRKEDFKRVPEDMKPLLGLLGYLGEGSGIVNVLLRKQPVDEHLGFCWSLEPTTKKTEEGIEPCIIATMAEIEWSNSSGYVPIMVLIARADRVQVISESGLSPRYIGLENPFVIDTLNLVASWMEKVIENRSKVATVSHNYC